MEEMELLAVTSEGRLTPRLFRFCVLYDTYPVDSVFCCFDPGERLGIMDINSMENDEFSNPVAAHQVKIMALQTDSTKASVTLRVSPAPMRVPTKAISVLQSDVKTRLKPSIFDVVSPAPKGAGSSKSAEQEAMAKAVSSLLAFVSDSLREQLMGGYSSMPLVLRQRLLHDAVANMGSVVSISQCARVLQKADSWLRAHASSSHGFRMEEGYVMWFLYDHAIQDDEGYHVSEYLRSGLVFAKLHLKMPIDVRGDLTSAFSKRVLHTPVPAVSASVRLVISLLRLANNSAYNGRVRYYAAAFSIKALAALRGIDSQRSSLKKVNGTFFVACAWNSKKKRAMVWACPRTFAGYKVVEIVELFWEGDYMFPCVTGKRGCSLMSSTGFDDRMASASVILRHFRGLAEIIGMPEEAAKVIRRHSWRHFCANITRVAEFAPADKEQVGRWGSLESMPIRYAQEVEEVTMMAIILKVEAVVVKALDRVPLDQWPWIAGWEHLSPNVSLRPSDVVSIPLACEPEDLDRVSDDEDSDEESITDEITPYGSLVEDRIADEVVQAWDDFISSKQPGKLVVHGWALEYVLRKSGDRTAGDCYAKRAGCPRLRSRVALLEALNRDRMEVQAIPDVGPSAVSISTPIEEVADENAKETDEQPMALAARMDENGMPVDDEEPPAPALPMHVPAAVEVAKAPAVPVEENEKEMPVDDVEPPAPARPMHVPEAVEEAEAPAVPVEENDTEEGGPSEEPRRKTPKWLERMGGFGDGDTSLSPPHNGKRRAL